MHYEQIPAGYHVTTLLPSIDYETYSEAGYIWDATNQKWLPPAGTKDKGIKAVGGAAYAAHPSTEVLMVWYDLLDGRGRRCWVPGMPPPLDLFAHVANGGLLEAVNSMFEFNIWNRVCRRRYDWPALPLEQLRDTAAKARAWALPGSLGGIGEVLQIADAKQSEGKRLIQKFSVPQKPTKKRPTTRIMMDDEPIDAALFFSYGEGDIIAEHQSSALIPDLPPEELEFWLADQRCNARGVQIDMETADAGVAILDDALERYNQELHQLTGGAVERASQTERLKGWLATWGVHIRSFDAKEGHVDAVLEYLESGPARRALEIRQLVGSASVKKLYALQRQVVEGRAYGLFIYHRARTGRDGGADIQPQNLPKAGPDVRQCGDATCTRWYGAHLEQCPYCRAGAEFSEGPQPWNWEAVEDAVEAVRTGSLDYVEYMFGDALLTLSGCIRGLFIAAPGHDLLCSDYSSIEAVVTAVLAGEQWRIEAFERGDDIYLASCAQSLGHSLEWYMANGGKKHPDRQKFGKPMELGCGFQGYIGALKQFGFKGTDEEAKDLVLAWRRASPMIEELWGGQVRGKPWRPERRELYGLEGAAISAVQNPGQCFRYRLISYQVHDDVLYCRLPSGRLLAYHRPRLSPSTRWDGQLELSFEGYNSNPKMGPIGWHRMKTYGGKLTENAVQATARDFLRDAAIRLERAGYPMVLRVHDEIVCEVPEGFGSVEELERLMEIRPAWAANWPIRAAGGWRAKRYRKD